MASKQTKHAIGTVRGKSDPGKLVPKGTRLVRIDGGGEEYVTLADVTTTEAEDFFVPVAAVAPGPTSVLPPGALLRFKSPIPDVDDELDVDAGGVVLDGAGPMVAAGGSVAAASSAAPVAAGKVTASAPAAVQDAVGRHEVGARCRIHLNLNGVGRINLPGEVLELNASGMARVRARHPLTRADLEFVDVPPLQGDGTKQDLPAFAPAEVAAAAPAA